MRNIKRILHSTETETTNEVAKTSDGLQSELRKVALGLGQGKLLDRPPTGTPMRTQNCRPKGKRDMSAGRSETNN